MVIYRFVFHCGGLWGDGVWFYEEPRLIRPDQQGANWHLVHVCSISHGSSHRFVLERWALVVKCQRKRSKKTQSDELHGLFHNTEYRGLNNNSEIFSRPSTSLSNVLKCLLLCVLGRWVEDHEVVHNIMFNTTTNSKVLYKQALKRSEWWDNGALPLWITAQNQVSNWSGQLVSEGKMVGW